MCAGAGRIHGVSSFISLTAVSVIGVFKRCDVTFQDFMFVFKMCFFQFQDLIIFVENPFKPVLDTVLPHTCPCNTEKT